MSRCKVFASACASDVTNTQNQITSLMKASQTDYNQYIAICALYSNQNEQQTARLVRITHHSFHLGGGMACGKQQCVPRSIAYRLESLPLGMQRSALEGKQFVPHSMHMSASECKNCNPHVLSRPCKAHNDIGAGVLHELVL